MERRVDALVVQIKVNVLLLGVHEVAHGVVGITVVPEVDGRPGIEPLQVSTDVHACAIRIPRRSTPLGFAIGKDRSRIDLCRVVERGGRCIGGVDVEVRQIVDLLLAHDAENPLKPLRREVTVVFMDLRGFTAFAEVSEPEDAMSALQEYHSEMGGIILKHDGTIMTFAGDGIMIVFNAPIEVPNPSERAVRMTVAMRDRLIRLGDKWQKLGYQLDCGFGIAQGYATIGAVGFEGCWDYGAIGTVSNLASRLCDEAKGGQILISKKVLNSLEGTLVTEPLPPLQLKGFSRSVSAFSVIRFKGAESEISSGS